MESETHLVLGGKAYLFKRSDSSNWQCAAYVDGRNHRGSTKEHLLQHAIKYAEDWYIELRAAAVMHKTRDDMPGPQRTTNPSPHTSHQPVETKKELTFREAADQFKKEYQVITEGHRSEKWVESHEIRLRLHLLPFFGDLPLSQVTAGKVQEYRVQRMTLPGAKNPNAKDNRPLKQKLPARKTLHNEMITLRHVLTTALRHNWLAAVPDLSTPYKTQGKVSHRAWFSPAEYKQLYEATRKAAKTALKHEKWDAEQLHDYVLFMVNTGLRPDEAGNLQHRDVEIVVDEDMNEEILLIEVNGKTGVGYCKSTPNAVIPYRRLLARPKPNRDPESTEIQLPQPTDLVFPSSHVKRFNSLLTDIALKQDRHGNARTSYGLRHTYICLRLMDGADIYQIAKNCRTSMEMIEKFYAAHIKNSLNAAAINIRRPKPTRKQVKAEKPSEGS